MQVTIDISEGMVAKANELGITPEAYANQILADVMQESAADRIKKVERFLSSGKSRRDRESTTDLASPRVKLQNACS